jgi:hypothetical protein
LLPEVCAKRKSQMGDGEQGPSGYGLPTQDRVRCQQASEILKHPAADGFATHRQAASLIIGEAQPAVLQMLAQDAVLFFQVVNGSSRTRDRWALRARPQEQPKIARSTLAADLDRSFDSGRHPPQQWSQSTVGIPTPSQAPLPFHSHFALTRPSAFARSPQVY